MQSFADLVTDNPSAITQVIISDLHLSMNEPATNPLVQAFLDFLDKLALLPNLKQFFILGDWFEAWLGDDVADTDTLIDALQPIIAKLKTLSDKNCQIFVMHGNRDFLLGQQFCDKFGGQLIFEPFYLTLSGKKVRLEHGDALCTDDKGYQRFRKIIQHPISKKFCSRYPSKNANKSRKIYAKRAKLIMPKNLCKSWMSMNKPSDKPYKKLIY